MTATADFMESKGRAVEPVRMADGGRMVIRGMQRLFGAALMLAAFGGMSPRVAVQHDMMLLRLILSVAAVIAGAGLLLASATPDAPSVQIDTIRREIKLVRVGRGGKADVVQRSAFSDLGRAEVDGFCVRLWDAEDRLLAEVTLANGPLLNSLIAGLRDAGKLA